MNLNDRRLNAYQNLAKSDSERSQDAASIASSSKESASIAVKALTQGGLLKVPVQPPAADGKESVYRRVAKFLLLIGENEAAKIMPHLTEEQIEKIVPELASIRRVEPEEAHKPRLVAGGEKKAVKKVVVKVAV